MIQAKDLRVGNYIHISPYKNDMQQVIDVMCDGVNTKDWQCAHYDLVQPVELTEELLVRFGFKPATRSPYIDKRAWSIGEEESRIFWCEGYLFKTTGPNSFIHLTPFMRMVEYAHTLQNAIEVLTGEELTLKQL